MVAMLLLSRCLIVGLKEGTMAAQILVEVWDRDMVSYRGSRSFSNATELITFVTKFRAAKGTDRLTVHIPGSLADDRRGDVAALGGEWF